MGSSYHDLKSLGKPQPVQPPPGKPPTLTLNGPGQGQPMYGQPGQPGIVLNPGGGPAPQGVVQSPSQIGSVLRQVPGFNDVYPIALLCAAVFGAWKLYRFFSAHGPQKQAKDFLVGAAVIVGIIVALDYI
mgnify:FL=1